MPATRQDLIQQHVRRTFERLEHLPATPEVLVRLWQMIDRPETTLDDLARIIGADASLSISLLRLVNSATFARQRRITEVRDAVQFVGFGEVKNISIAIVVKTGLLLRPASFHCFDRLLIWRHFVGTAVASNLLARRLALPSAEEAFTAGLLHDVGMVVMDQSIPDDQRKVLTIAESMEWQIEEIEERLLGFTHGEVGVWLGECWSFPRSVLVPMVFHRKPWEAPKPAELSALVHVGDVLASEESQPYRTNRRAQVDPRALAILKVEPPILDKVRADLRSELEKLTTLLEMAV